MQVPPELLARLDEFCTGGFALFTTNSEGSIDEYFLPDNHLMALALRKHIDTWSKTNNEIEVDINKQITMLELQEQQEAEIKRQSQEKKRKRKSKGEDIGNNNDESDYPEED